MITEDFCSFEVAKLLKEKGFDESCSFVVNAISKSVMPVSWPTTNSDVEDEKASLIALPTHQMAMKWLREKGIECVIIPIWNTFGKQYRSYVLSDLGDRYKDNYDSYSDNISYEDAAEAALKYVLENLI